MRAAGYEILLAGVPRGLLRGPLHSTKTTGLGAIYRIEAQYERKFGISTNRPNMAQLQPLLNNAPSSMYAPDNIPARLYYYMMGMWRWLAPAGMRGAPPKGIKWQFDNGNGRTFGSKGVADLKLAEAFKSDEHYFDKDTDEDADDN